MTTPTTTRLDAAIRAGSHADPRTDTHSDPNRSTTMNLMHEELARIQMSERLGEAHTRRDQRLAKAKRLARRSEAAAQQARLALARAL
ncbi:MULTISPECIES: hypothetical protein [unclassified Nocardioides]|uniref:hypothetical protein n=1 Tax=unclassified Nocardioides TaxID=2615069 RepID=UPI000702790D|nr:MULTISPECIES: hypothetical protein [unclassified Nocardioides]KQP64472.1 hypothetical protein ASF47_10925 [Nocardioides sp. Leaf285]KQQ43481.1 hypothetical protein ASF50_05955 [Nocardioides sp. Leaf307]